MAITRGHTYQPDDVVTNENLHNLVERAAISGLDLQVMGSNFVGVSINTSYTTAPGWLSYVQHAPTALSSVSGNGGDCMIELASIHGPVACFMNGGMETRRFTARHGADWNFHMWGGPYAINTPTAGVTLTVGFSGGNDAYGNPVVLGSNARFTASTSPTDPAGQPRIVMQGLTPFRQTSAAPNGNVLRFIYSAGALTAEWACTQSTSVDKVFGHSMQSALASGTCNLVGWLYGAPVWRI